MGGYSCPALVSEDIWNECNRLLDESEKKRKRLGPQAKHLLAGYVHCTCDKKMYVFHETKSSTYSCKKCKNRIAVADLDEIFHDQLKTFFLTDISISEYLQKIDITLQEKNNLLNSMLDERETVKKKMDRLVNLRINEEMDKQNFAEHYRPLEERSKQINDQLPELQAEIDFLTIQHKSSDTVLHDAKDLYSQWDTLTFEDKRAIVEVITERITIDSEDISIKLSYVPTQPPPISPKWRN